MLANYFTQEKIILPLSDLVTGNSVSKYLKFLQKSKFWSREKLDDFQNERLRILIKHAYENVPYYHDTMKSLGLTPNDIQSKEDLHKLPVLTKAIIKREGIERFTAKNIKQNKIMKKTSSGSTGELLKYICTKEAYSVNLAANLRGWYDMGYRLGDRYIKLSQNTRSRFIKRLQDYISLNKYLSTDPLTEKNFERLLIDIENYKPSVIRCYPDPLLLLAKYKVQNPAFKYKPMAITTTGNTLHLETRRVIEKAFNCKIFDSYSCEGNPCVFECRTHSCYHSTDEYGISEILDNNGKIIKKGTGKLYSTDLWNFAHPFIRYDTHDIIEIDDTPCVCGRSHLKIIRILGRDNEVISSPSGRKFPWYIFVVFFMSDYANINNTVEHFQVIKKINETVLFKLVVNSLFAESTKYAIIEYWEKEFGMKVYIEFVEQIIIEHNNKCKLVVNE